MSQKRPRYRYSWKKPWAFDNYHDMRRYITEREVYKKLMILERHSSFKKPYWNFGTHPQGELRYSAPGFPPGDRYPPFEPPEGPTGPGYNCQMACNGGMLDCERGGCDTITCICNIPPMYGKILEDPTGDAYIVGNGGHQLQVCIPPQKSNEKYGVIIVEVLDSAMQIAITEHPLVDCEACCDEFTLTGSTTVNPGATWTGTVDPCCDDAIVEVTSNGCGPGAGTISPDGCTVEVEVGDSDCGAFTVTVSQDVSGCDEQTASFVVRINNTGQGGDWAWHSAAPSDCTGGACGCVCNTTYPFTACIYEDFKYGIGPALDCSNQYGYNCRPDPAANPCTVKGGAWPPCHPGGDSCSGACPGCGFGTPVGQCIDKIWHKCQWSCSC